MPSRVRIYDDGGKTADRYTLVVPSADQPRTLDMFGFSENPFHPQGFGQYAGDYPMMGSYSHLGRLVSLNELPKEAQRYVSETLRDLGIALPKSWLGKKTKKDVNRKRKRRSSPVSVSGSW